MVPSAGLLRVAGREGEHASRATTLSSLSRTPSRRCCERRSTQDSTALHETAKLRVVQLISDVMCFARTATTWRRMAHRWFRLRPSGGTIKPRTFLYLGFFGKIDLRCKGYAAFVEVGVVRLLFKILKQLVAFMRNCQRRDCCSRGILSWVRRLGDRCRRSSHLLRRTWLGRGRVGSKQGISQCRRTLPTRPAVKR